MPDQWPGQPVTEWPAQPVNKRAMPTARPTGQGAPPSTTAPAPPVPQDQIQQFYQQYFFARTPNANKPLSLAMRLKDVPAADRQNDPVLKQYKSPIARAAVLQRASELAGERESGLIQGGIDVLRPGTTQQVRQTRGLKRFAGELAVASAEPSNIFYGTMATPVVAALGKAGILGKAAIAAGGEALSLPQIIEAVREKDPVRAAASAALPLAPFAVEPLYRRLFPGKTPVAPQAAEEPRVPLEVSPEPAPELAKNGRFLPPRGPNGRFTIRRQIEGATDATLQAGSERGPATETVRPGEPGGTLVRGSGGQVAGGEGQALAGASGPPGRAEIAGPSNAPPEALVPRDVIEGSTPESPVMPPSPGKGTGRYRGIYRFSKPVADMLYTLAEVRGRASREGIRSFESVTKGLNEEQKQNLGRYLVGKRLWDEAAGAEIPPTTGTDLAPAPSGTAFGGERTIFPTVDAEGKVYEGTGKPLHPQALSPSQQAEILQDPKIAAAVPRYVEVKNAIEGERLRAGLPAEVAATKSPEFISLVPPAEGEGGGAIGGGSVASRFRQKTTRFANQATLTGKEYSTDLRHILGTSWREVLPKSSINDFYDVARAHGQVSDTPTTQVLKDGTRVPWKAVEHLMPWKGKQIYMPAPIADALQDAVVSAPRLDNPFVVNLARAWGRGAVSLQLTGNPAEAIGHIRRQASLLRGIPSVNRGHIQNLLESTPILGDAITVGKLWRIDFDHPFVQDIERSMYDAGAGSVRPFQTYKSGLVQKIPGLKQWQDQVHEFLFGLPKGKGFRGWDARVRVAAEMIRREAEGNADPQRIRDFAAQFNQYMEKPDVYVQALKGVNPYAATGVPTRITGLKQAVGISGLKAKSTPQAVSWAVQTIARRTAAPILGGIILNKELSGHYPWQNAPGHQHQIEVGKDKGKPVYMDYRGLDPVLGQVVTETGGTEMSREEKFKAKQRVPIGETVPIGALNAAMQVISNPGANAVLETITGNVPYFRHYPGQGVKMVNIASKSDIKGRAIQAAKSINPIGGFLGNEEGEQSGKPSGAGYGLLNFLLSQSIKEEPKKKIRP